VIGPRQGRVLRRTALVGVGLLTVGGLAHRTAAGLELMMIGGLLLLASALVWRRYRAGSAVLVRRWARRTTRQDGVASRWAILATASLFAARRKTTVLRPSLRQQSLPRRLGLRTREVATPIARVGLLRVWSPIEDVTLRIGGPRVGKSGELACRILDAPGAVIATSTRTDLVELTAACRSQRGPVWVFNPSGLGGVPSTVTFDPLDGCTEPRIAAVRAADLLAGAEPPGAQYSGDREFWTAQARRVLMSLMHAAALGGGSMRDVLAWVADPDAAAGEVQRLLRRSPEPAFEPDARQFLTTNDRTRSSICATIMPALGWLTDALAAAAAGQSIGRQVLLDETGVTTIDDSAYRPTGLDVAALLAERGTVYLLGAQDAQVAPLVTALTGHVARIARQLAASMPSGRLDPPLTLVLDEAALICPIPLDEWTADMGGRNITMHIAAQSRAQLRKRWQDTGAAAILNNAGTVLLFGGTRDPDDLHAYTTLIGERDEPVKTYDRDGRLVSTTVRRSPVLSPSQLAQLPAGRVVIIRRGMPPAIGTVTMAWQRRDVRAAARRLQRTERAAERAVARARRQVVWARRRAWVAARAARLLTALTAMRRRLHRAATRPADRVDGPVAVEEGGRDA
jgi:type IV secretory pathway TraG/TraD family ATPase VirD4